MSLQAFIDRTPDDRVISFKAGGIYLLGDRGLHVISRRNLTFEGNGAILHGSGCSVAQSMFLIEGQASQRIVIRGFTLEGENPEPGTPRAYRSDCEYQMESPSMGPATSRSTR